ncbi:MAG: tetratricopeptide repeat protein [Acidobacteriota bacterium]
MTRQIGGHRSLALFFLSLAVALASPAAESGDVLARAAAELEQGRFAQAEAGLRAFLRAHPGNARARGLLGAALDSQQKFDEAEAVYKEALRLAPGSALLWNNYGNHLASRGDAEGARQAFERTLRIDPSHPNANLQLARLAVERRQGTAALEYLARVRAQGNPAIELLRAEALFRASRKTEALNAFDRLERAHDADPRVHYSVGVAYIRLGQFERAEAAFSSALAKAPGDADALYSLGLAAAGAGHDRRAEEVLQTLLRQRPDDASVLFELGRLRGRAGDFEGAIPLFTRAVRLAPERAEVHLSLARALEEEAFCEDAARVYDHYLGMRPKDEEARRERAMVYGHVGPLREKGRAEFEAYLARHPQDALGHLLYARLLNAIPGSEGALREATRAIELDPKLAEARLTRAALLSEEGEPEKALVDLEFLAQHDIKDARALDQLGIVYLSLNRAADAERVLRQAQALAPNDHKVLLHLGRALSQLDRTEEAARILAHSEQSRRQRGSGSTRAGLLGLLAMPAGQQHAALVDHLRKACEREARNLELRLQLASALLDGGNDDEAAAVLQEILQQNPTPELALRAARAALPADLFQQAADFYQIAVRQDPSVRVELAMARYFLSGAPAALDELEAITPAQRSADYYLLKARILDLMGRSEDSVKVLDQGLSEGPVRPSVAYLAAALLVKADRHALALTLLERTGKAAPDNPAIALAQAIVLALAGRAVPAEQAFTRLEARWPEWGRPFLMHGLALRERGKAAGAARLLRAAAALGETESPGMTVRSAFLDYGLH